MTALAAERPQPSQSFVVGHLLAASLFWGSSFLFIKLLNGELSPWAVAALRGGLGALTLALWIALLGQRPWPARSEWKDWLVLGTCNGWVPNVLVAYALTQLDSGPAAMIQASGPLVTAVFAHLAFADERLTLRRLAGVGLGFGGVLLIMGPSAFAGGGSLLGVLAMIGVTLGYATGNLYTRAIPVADPARLALGQQFVSGLVALAITLALAGPAAFAPAGQHIPALLALGVVCTALPMAIFMRLIRAAGPTRAALTGYLVPTVAVILGVAVLGERLTLTQSLGGLVVLAGVGLVTSRRQT